MKKPPKTAIALVIGGSMAGLLAARVLGDYFAEVVIVERDTFPEGPIPRNGVPQSYQPHIFLIRGLETVETLLPGICREMVAAGGQRGNVGDWCVVTPAGLAHPAKMRRDAIGATRPLFEWCVRRRVAALPGVRFITSAEVTRLENSPDRQRIAGVRVRYRRGAHGPEVLTADLVVDASGRHSKTPAWLEAIGYEAPPEERVQVDVGYSSRLYRRPDDFSERWHSLLIMPRPPHKLRMGVMAAVEGGQWCVTLGGAAGEQPPTDEAGFLSWARTLPVSSLFEVIRRAEPASRVRGFGIPTTQWRHFERLARWPGNFIVLGDAVCAFNPFYGQGMTVATLEAQVLGKVLQMGTEPGWEQRFQRRLAELVAIPWSMALNEDLRLGGVRMNGRKAGLNARVADRYLSLLFPAVCADEVVSHAYFEVFNMLAKPASLMRPRILLRVLRNTLRRTRQPLPPARAIDLPATSHTMNSRL